MRLPSQKIELRVSILCNVWRPRPVGKPMAALRGAGRTQGASLLWTGFL